MSEKIEFETPENVKISYQLAGLGTRFVAWVVDSILLWVLAFVIFIVLLAAGASMGGALDALIEPDRHISQGRIDKFLLVMLAIFWVIFSLGSFAYFGLCELLLRGQTIGKRQMRIRVAKSDGFALDATSIFVRSIFRLVDQLPMLWVVPLFTENQQRLGDLVAGTVVIADAPPIATGARQELAARKPSESHFRFDATVLKRARRQDVEAVERILERWASLSPAQRLSLLERIVPPLATRLQVECPTNDERLQFLEDFVAAELRRQHRSLG